jgi:hypothetical protein
LEFLLLPKTNYPPFRFISLKYSPHTPQPTLPHKCVTLGKFCFDFKLEAVDNNADANGAIEADADKADVTDKANEAFEADKANKADKVNEDN